MPDLNVYNLAVRTEHPVPPDVLIEHLAVALRDFNFLGKVGINMTSAATTETYENRAHPFDGPEVFDDSPQLEPYTGPRPAQLNKPSPGGYLPTRYPMSGTLTDGEAVYPLGTHAEGSFYAQGGKYEPVGIVHKGSYPQDPFPLTTNAIDSLKESRRD